MMEITKKTKEIVGIILIAIALSGFIVSYNQGLLGQDRYSRLGCAVDARPLECIITNSQMITGFVAMIFTFFMALFGASLIVPQMLMKLIKKVKR